MKRLKSAILKGEEGVAMLMVLTSVALLSVLLADFTFETQLNKVKVFNLQEKTQAKLNAESGVRFAMAKLRLYQEGRNVLEKNSSLKGTIEPSQIESIVTQPFIFPIPNPSNANLIQRTAIEEFVENTLIKGQLSVSVTPVSGFLNPNNLRVSPSATPTPEPDPDSDKPDPPQVYIEKKMLETLKSSIESKRESDDEFDAKYAALNPELLIKELKYFVNEKDAYDEPEKSEIEALYLQNDAKAKHAPLSSIEEMYLLQGWDDVIVDLVKDRFTAHEVSIIAVNELTEEQLKIIFPDITPIQIEEFFKHRDGDPELQIKPQKFKNAQDFKSVVTEKLGILDEQNYNERIKQFEDAGLKIAVAGKLYKVVSEGSFGRSSYKITAFVDLPLKPEPIPTPTPTPGPNATPTPTPTATPTPAPVELMQPRVIEIQAN